MLHKGSTHKTRHLEADAEEGYYAGKNEYAGEANTEDRPTS
jgi:hypothetical protein